MIFAGIFVILPQTANGTNSAITYRTDNAGRLGDCIVIYCKAKYLSMKYNLPLLFKPFAYSDQFAMHTDEIHYGPDHKFDRTIMVNNIHEINPELDNTLFMTDLFTSTGEPYIAEKQFTERALSMPLNFWIDEIYDLMQQNNDYKKIIKKMLQPSSPYKKHFQKSSEDTITVAVHIRKGTQVDLPLRALQLYSPLDITGAQETPDGMYHDILCPLRFPPEQFYIDQINKLSKHFHDKKLFIQIFTDHNNPEEIFEHIKNNCAGTNCTFSLATSQWQNDIVKDMCEMAEFDCLIRPCSHFSGAAQLMGDHKLILIPKNYTWIGNYLLITETKKVVNDSNFKNF